MKESLHCIIVDDEEGAHAVLDHYINRLKTLTISASFYNAIEAMEYLYKNPVDLMFLDINMPGLSGLSMLEILSRKPFVVLTTAYKEYALEGYKYQVVDYLVKPIEFPNFLSAVDKVLSRINSLNMDNKEETEFSPKADYIILKVDGSLIKLMIHEIQYIQSLGNYIKVFTSGKSYLSAMTTSEIESKLNGDRFIRIHKSYIIALNQVQKINGTTVNLKGDINLPIGNTFRRELLKHFQ